MTALALLTMALSAAPAEEFKLSEDEQKVLELANAERKKVGAPPLNANPQLFAAARGHSMNMAAKQMLEHTLDGKTFDARIKDQGYRFSAAAENVAGGQRTPAAAIESWMNSEGHKTNLLNPAFTDIGIGVAKGANGQLYWTQVFAKPLK